MRKVKPKENKQSDSRIDYVRYFTALTAEVYSLKDRVRNFIKDSHWLTDGEWKESVLRSILRRHLPITIGVARGFVVSSSGRSSQIDILIYRKTHPVLYQDGDLVFVAPDAVMGIIEVKTTLNPAKFKGDLGKVLKNYNVLQRNRRPGQNVELPFPFCGLFYYSAPPGLADDLLLDALDETAKGCADQMIQLVSVGRSLLIRQSEWEWKESPGDGGARFPANRWLVDLLKDQGPGCFINNVICRLCPYQTGNFPELWSPYAIENFPETKERRLSPRK